MKWWLVVSFIHGLKIKWYLPVDAIARTIDDDNNIGEGTSRGTLLPSSLSSSFTVSTGAADVVVVETSSFSGVDENKAELIRVGNDTGTAWEYLVVTVDVDLMETVLGGWRENEWTSWWVKSNMIAQALRRSMVDRFMVDTDE